RRARAYSSVPSTRSLVRPSSRRPPAAASRVRAIAASTVGGLNVGSSIAPNLARDVSSAPRTRAVHASSRGARSATQSASTPARSHILATSRSRLGVSRVSRTRLRRASRPAGAPATLSLPLPADLTEAAVGEGGSEDLLTALLEALRRNDAGALRAIAALAVQRFGGLDVQRDGSVQYYLYRVLRQLDLSNLMQRAMRDGGGTGADARRLGDRLLQDEHRHRIEAFRRLIADEIRHRLLE